MRYARMSVQYENVLEQLNLVFSIVFNLEMVCKLLGMGMSYFNSAWNKFDMLIVFGTDFGILLKVIKSGIDISTAATVVRAFRIMRILRLIRSSKTMRILIDTLVNIIPSITNVMSLIFLLFFIYSALGINLFSTVMLQEQLNEYNNF
jgi:hypothetical protein